jgi:uncharacterized protein (TIGR03437 family)
VHPGAIVSNFHPARGAPLAPGLPIQVFGETLSAEAALATALPLPSSLAETTLLIGAREAPLFYVSPGQINAQVPPDLPTGTQYATVVMAGDKYTVTDPIVLATVRPSLVSLGGALIARHADGTEVSARAPARGGEEIVLYAAGLGATTPAVPGGTVPPPGMNAQVQERLRLIIGGREAAVRSAALAPDAVGVYRVTIETPSGLPAGSHAVEIEQGGVVGNRASINLGQ